MIFTGTGADIVSFTGTSAAAFATETGSTAGTAVVYASGSVGDTISDFVSGTDKISFATAAITSAAGTLTDTAKVIAAAGTVANTDRFVIITTNQADLAFATSVALLNGLTTTAVAIGDSFVAAIDNGTSTNLYYVKQVSAADTIAAQDVTFLAQLVGTAQLANGDFITA